jgi:hypothetical protein
MDESSKKVAWVAPLLEEIPMVDTATKGGGNSENKNFTANKVATS